MIQNNVQINAAGLALLESLEALRLTAYQDIRGVWTIGWGSTRDVTAGMTITLEEAQQRLKDDLAETCLRVSNLVKWPLNENQISAVICFTFNEGSGHLEQSTLLRCINTGHLEDAANEFGKWNKVNGVVCEDLVGRRKAERALFNSPVVVL